MSHERRHITQRLQGNVVSCTSLLLFELLWLFSHIHVDTGLLFWQLVLQRYIYYWPPCNGWHFLSSQRAKKSSKSLLSAPLTDQSTHLTLAFSSNGINSAVLRKEMRHQTCDAVFHIFQRQKLTLITDLLVHVPTCTLINSAFIAKGLDAVRERWCTESQSRWRPFLSTG